jgi:hypothetical protein
MTRLETALQKWGLQWDTNFDSLSIQIGNKLFMPIRLVEYNLLGAFGVIAWIGVDTVLTSLESTSLPPLVSLLPLLILSPSLSLPQTCVSTRSF